MGFYREPTKAPRGPDPIGIEGRRRMLSAARLDNYFVPKFCDTVTGYRQVVVTGPQKALGPLSPVQEGLRDLVSGVEETQNAKS